MPTPVPAGTNMPGLARNLPPRLVRAVPVALVLMHVGIFGNIAWLSLVISVPWAALWLWQRHRESRGIATPSVHWNGPPLFLLAVPLVLLLDYSTMAFWTMMLMFIPLGVFSYTRWLNRDGDQGRLTHLDRPLVRWFLRGCTFLSELVLSSYISMITPWMWASMTSQWPHHELAFGPDATIIPPLLVLFVPSYLRFLKVPEADKSPTKPTSLSVTRLLIVLGKISRFVWLLLIVLANLDELEVAGDFVGDAWRMGLFFWQ